jgi:hypothetical protein
MHIRKGRRNSSAQNVFFATDVVVALFLFDICFTKCGPSSKVAVKSSCVMPAAAPHLGL